MRNLLRTRGMAMLLTVCIGGGAAYGRECAELGAKTAPRAWRWDPGGRTWADFFNPVDDTTFMNIGMDLQMRLETPGRADLFLTTSMRTRAGYHNSTNPTTPRTPVDLLYQAWDQMLGGTWRGPVNAHVFMRRVCIHQLDKSGFDPVVWTDLAAGAGSLSPALHPAAQIPRMENGKLRWFVGGGPTLHTGARSIWTINSPVRTEAWGRMLAVRPLGRAARMDVYNEATLQRCSSGAKVRHALRSEVGLTLLAGQAGWRFYAGRMWRDTRAFWPADQKVLTGLAFLY